VLFVHAGTIRDAAAPYAALYAISRTRPPGPWHVDGLLPKDLPSARDYWLVFRCDRQTVPGLTAGPLLAAGVSRLRQEARDRNLNVVGVQLDIDSPTAALSQYAVFLHEVKTNLPTGLELSITALLDWFRGGTAIDEVIRQVDEFVPQFYDVDSFDSYSGGSSIRVGVLFAGRKAASPNGRAAGSGIVSVNFKSEAQMHDY
jgi:hypothetical protein